MVELSANPIKEDIAVIVTTVDIRTTSFAKRSSNSGYFPKEETRKKKRGLPSSFNPWSSFSSAWQPWTGDAVARSFMLN
jgi:hypothetical protein